MWWCLGHFFLWYQKFKISKIQRLHIFNKLSLLIELVPPWRARWVTVVSLTAEPLKKIIERKTLGAKLVVGTNFKYSFSLSLGNNLKGQLASAIESPNNNLIITFKNFETSRRSLGSCLLALIVRMAWLVFLEFQRGMNSFRGICWSLSHWKTQWAPLKHALW